MNESLTLKALDQLISQVQIATSVSSPRYCHVRVWTSILLSHPDWFRIENDELLFLGDKVGLIGCARERDKFCTLANKILKEN